MAEKRLNDDNVIVGIPDVLQKTFFVIIKIVVNEERDVGRVGNFVDVAGIFVDYRLFFYFAEGGFRFDESIEQAAETCRVHDRFVQFRFRGTAVDGNDFQAVFLYMRTQFAAAAETVVDGNAAEMPSVVFGRGGISQIRFGLFQMRQEDRVVGINAFAPRLVVTVKMVFPQAFCAEAPLLRGR